MEQTALWCPRCLGPVGQAAACPGCGLPQLGADAARLRVVVHRLYQVDERRRALAAEAADLVRERARLLEALAPEPPVVPSRSRAEWRPAVVRGLLLGVGSVLVALAALIFAAVAWVRLGDAGRAGLLAAATLAAAAGSAAARRRLPATGEALGLLALALLLVDWYALRRAGVAGSWAPTTWWAVGTATAAALAAAAGRWLRLQAPAAAVLGQLSAVLVAAGVADSPWGLATGLALVAAAATAAAGLVAGRWRWTGGAVGRGPEPPARPGPGSGWRRWSAVALEAGAAVLELGALALVLLGPVVDGPAGPGGPALALAAMALAPAVARAMPAGWAGAVAGHALVAASAGALLGAAATLLTARWTSWPLAAAVAGLGAAGVAAGRLLPRPLAPGTALAAAATLAVGLVGLAEPIVAALAAPAAWVAAPWTARLTDPATDAFASAWPDPALAPWAAAAGWPAVAGLLAATAAAIATAIPGNQGLVPASRPTTSRSATDAAAPSSGPGWPAPVARLAWAVGALAIAGLVAVLPLAAGWPLWAALALTTAAALAAGAASVLLDRRTSDPAAALAVGAVGAGLLLLAGAWGLASEAGTLWFLGMAAVAGIGGTAASRGTWLRRGWAAVAAGAVAAEAGAVAAANGAGTARAGFAVALAGGAVLVAGTRWRPRAAEGPVVEAVGLAGLALGVALATAGQRWLAASLTAAVPPLLLAAAARPPGTGLDDRAPTLRAGRSGYRWVSAAVAVAAIWAWLAVGEVTLLEAYTLPAAAVAGVAGAAARRGRPRPGSWAAYGPGLALALLPSLGVAVGGVEPTRPLALSVGALLAVLAGARARLQAPLVLGAGTLVLLGLDAALPVAARLPRWVSVGGTGLLLLWLGATAERRLAKLRRLRRRLGELEPDGGLRGAG